jgi:hypothetical protein
VFVHHDSNAWISDCLKFESLKNEFEKNLKKKRKTSSLSLSFLSNRPTPSSSLRIPWASGLFLSSRARSQPTAAQPALPAGPTPRPLPFLFAPEADRWGPAVRPFPYLQPRVSRAPFKPPAVTGQVHRSPAIKTP